MSSWRKQALIEAPAEAVWEMVGDPERYPEWAAAVLDVTGLASREEGEEFEQVTRTPLGRPTRTTFRIDELENLREIRLSCQASGLYSRWLLTEAQDNTFVDVEIGMDPTGVRPRAFDATIGKRWYRRLAEDSLDGLRNALRGGEGDQAHTGADPPRVEHHT